MSHSTSDQGVSSSRRKNFDLRFKLKAINHAERYTNSKASRDFKVHRRQIQKWREQKAKIESQISSNSSNNDKRLSGAGRPLINEDFDVKLMSWIVEQRRQKLRVSRKLIQKQAIIFSTDKTFKASNGWLQKFLFRHNLSLRRPTTVCQKEPDEYKGKIIDYILFIEKKRQNYKYQHIYAADETAVYIDFSNNLTVEKRGAREIPVRSTGHDKLHITVMLTARSDGYKCRPFVLLPRVRPDKEISAKFKNKLQLCWSGQTFFNDTSTSEYLQTTIGPSFFGRRMLAWDSYRCHISQATKKKLKELQVDTVVIPGGCTKFVQAADVYWNAPFKSRIREFYENWMVHGEKLYTKSENIRAPSMHIYLQWIVDAWKLIPKELIINSFKGCGLTNALDGSEDDKIHCFKPNGSIPTGCNLLKQARADAMVVQLQLIEIQEEEENDYDSDESIKFC